MGRKKNRMNDLYICYTYYHLLITTVKALENNKRIDILVSNELPDKERIIGKLETQSFIDKLCLIDETPYLDEYNKKNRIISQLTKRSILESVFHKMTNMDVLIYENIYTYNDMNLASSFLIINNKKYHLIEDALDFFSYFDDYYHVKPTSYSIFGFQHFIKKILRLGTNPWGQNKYCIDIEVNDMGKIKIPKNRVIEVSRKELFDNLSKINKRLVYTLFAENTTIPSLNCKKTMILFTQPLFADRFVPSMDDQLFVFESIIKKYIKDGFFVTIKPHPRDLADYSKLIQVYNCNYIEKNIPSEILNFDENVSFDEIVSITSTSINFVERVKKRTFMGKVYIDRCLREKSRKNDR